jgi:hypothetical protein
MMERSKLEAINVVLPFGPILLPQRYRDQVLEQQNLRILLKQGQEQERGIRLILSAV